MKNRIAFCIIWHFGIGIIVCAIGLELNYEFSLAYRGYDFWGDLWSYTIYSILLIGLIVTMLSFVIHRLIRGWQTDLSNLRLGIYTTLLLMGLSFFLYLFNYFAFLIIPPLLIECLILSAIDWAWDKQFEEKPKRKNDEA